jgi:hypothetical protein
MTAADSAAKSPLPTSRLMNLCDGKPPARFRHLPFAMLLQYL